MTIDTFDSRALRRTDCYGQRFMRGGSYRYNVVAASGQVAVIDTPYVVEVVDEGSPEAAMQQHTVLVRADGKRFHPEAESVTISVGDLVLWHCPNAGAVPFVVVGDKESFPARRS